MTSGASPPLHVRTWPSAGPPPTLALLHGFTQNAECWGPFADELAAGHPLIALDAPGHGRSVHDDADLWQSADLVAATLAGTSANPPVVVGYSMGGRTALHLALAHPSSVVGMVLIGATAGIDDASERAARRTADLSLAAQIEAEPLPDFIDAWLANPLFAGLSREAACREARLVNRTSGLAASLRHCGTGTQEPLWGRLEEVAVPVLLITGRDDPKFTALAERLKGAMTGTSVRTITIDGSHAVHLEQPKAAASAISNWLSETIEA